MRCDARSVTALQTGHVTSHAVLTGRSAETFFAFLIVNGLQLEAARPECLIDTKTGAEFPFFHVFNLAKVAAPLLLLLSCSALRASLHFSWVRGWCGGMTARRDQVLDKLAVLETILVQVGRMPSRTIETKRSGGCLSRGCRSRNRSCSHGNTGSLSIEHRALSRLSTNARLPRRIAAR